MNDYRDYIAHFGILGMKWGVRRYQNPDGSLTDAGGKHYQKDYYKALKETSYKKQYRDHSDPDGAVARKAKIDNKTRRYIHKIDKNRALKIAEAYSKIKDTSKKGDFWNESNREMRNKASKEAYDKTLNWCKEHNKEYLDEIMKDGKSSDLTNYHDFRKLYEGFHDELLTKYESDFNKSHAKEVNAYKSAENEYHDLVRETANELLGNLGNRSLDIGYYKTTYNSQAMHIINRLSYEDYNRLHN